MQRQKIKKIKVKTLANSGVGSENERQIGGLVMNGKTLSPTMSDLLAYMKEYGDLYRFPGGFWANADWCGTQSGKWFGTSSVNALESRGLIRWTEWMKREGKLRFPIKAKLSDS